MKRTRAAFVPLLSAFLALSFAVAIIRYPQEAFNASLSGLRLWIDVVLPALLPFFAMADILMGLGVVHFIGVLLEPMMTSLFRIPGVGGFAVAMGLASGYPIGAKITGRLRREKLCTRVEGERLVSFANTADPLFMIGAVAIGMFGMPELGTTLALSHYLAVIMVGFLMRFHGSHEEFTATSPRKGYFGRAIKELLRAREQDGRPFGHLFNDAVRETFGAMLFVGGTIMMFSVLISVLTAAGIFDFATAIFTRLFSLLGLPTGIVESLMKGIFEITMGTEAASTAAGTLGEKVVAASAIIAWSGLSVHTQAAAMVHGTDIRIWPYILARFCHAVLAAAWTALFLGPLSGLVGAVQRAIPVVNITVPSSIGFWERMVISSRWCLSLFGGLILLGVIAATFSRVCVIWVHRSR